MDDSAKLWNEFVRQLSIKNMLLYHQERNRTLMKRAYEIAAELHVVSIVLDEVPFDQAYLELPCKTSIVTRKYEKIPDPWREVRKLDENYIDSMRTFHRSFESLFHDSVVDPHHVESIEYFMEKLRVYIGLMDRWRLKD